QQKEQIAQMMAAGNTAGAQAVILKELNKEFGGSAVAAGQANGGIAILTAKMVALREQIGQELIPIIGSLVGAFMPLVNTLVGDLPGAMTWVQQHGDDIKVVLASLASAAVIPLTAALAGLIPVIWGALAPIIAGAAPFILLGVAIAGVALYFKHLYDTSAPFRQIVGGLMADVRSLAAIFQQQLATGLTAVLPYLQQAAHWLGDELGQAAKALQPIIIQAAAAIQQFADGLNTRLGPAMHNVFGFIQAALPILASIWSAIWPTMEAVLVGVWNVIAGVVKIAWSLVSGIIEVGLDLLGGHWGQAWTDLKTMFAGVWAGIVQVFRGVWGILSSLIGAGLQLIGALWNAAWTGIKNAVGSLIGGIWSDIRSIFDAGVQFVNNLISGFVNTIVGWFEFLYNHNYFFKDLVDSIRAEFQLAQQIVTTVWNAIAGFLSGVWNHMKSNASEVFGFVRSIIQTEVTSYQTIISTAWNVIVGFLGGLGGRISGAIQGGVVNPIRNELTGLLGLAENWGRQLIQMFINGIGSMAGAAANAAANIAHQVAANLGFHSPTKEGPGADADTWAPNLMKMFAQGIVDSAPLVQRAAAGAMGGLKSGLTGSVTPSIAAGLMGPSTAQIVTQAIAANGG
ncbi:MAG TPA: hypothetical protein VKQ36_12605, partial [Ktedonobacterales bacterium]|nr:hypothetical protein [Ktedonobacterales bacterium]